MMYEDWFKEWERSEIYLGEKRIDEINSWRKEEEEYKPIKRIRNEIKHNNRAFLRLGRKRVNTGSYIYPKTCRRKLRCKSFV